MHPYNIYSVTRKMMHWQLLEGNSSVHADQWMRLFADAVLLSLIQYLLIASESGRAWLLHSVILHNDCFIWNEILIPACQMEETLSVHQATAVGLVTAVTGAQLIWLGLPDRCCVGLWLSVSGLMEPFGSRPIPAPTMSLNQPPAPAWAIQSLVWSRSALQGNRYGPLVSVSPAFGPHTGDMRHYLIEFLKQTADALCVTHSHTFIHQHTDACIHQTLWTGDACHS